jgi:hypothetical protein
MSASVHRAIVLAAVAGALAGCGGPARTELSVDIFNDPNATEADRPATVTLSWLDDYGFLVKDRMFVVPAGTGSYLGNVVVRIFVVDYGRRRAIVRGQLQLGGQNTSEGWGMGDHLLGDPEPPIPVMLHLLPAGAPDPYDADGDGVPDAVDNCLGLANPDQGPNDCPM